MLRIERQPHPEHEVIARVLGAFESLVDRLSRGEASGHELAGILEFLCAFITSRHEQRTAGASGPIVPGGAGLETSVRQALLAFAQAIERACREPSARALR